MIEIPKTREEKEKLLFKRFVGEQLQTLYDEKSAALHKVAKEIDIILEKIKDAESDIEKTTQPKECELNIKRWNQELEPLVEEVDSLWRDMERMHHQITIKVNKGCHELDLSKGRETVPWLSVVEG